MLCAVRAWDTEFFGIRIAEVCTPRLGPASAGAIRTWAARRDVACVYYLCPPDDDGSVAAAEGAGFHLVDVRLVFEADPAAIAEASPAARMAGEADAPRLKAIARDGYGGARFAFDPRFPAGRGPALYEHWIDRSCRGFASGVLVQDVEGVPAGFVSYHAAAGEVRVGLVGVAPEHRGRGIAQALLRAVAAHAEAAGATRITVATQLRNIGAQRVYQRAGFVTKETGLWYHLWL